MAAVTEVPDVTVVVAVYNTMPYLTECLESLVGQSIGLGRMEVVAVDDGSTDASGKELDRFQALYPEVFTVLRQPNSGGPAAPSNRALDVARGRYVFFVGSDDYLGPEALERMVAAADEHRTDVVVAKMVGVNDRWVPQAVFERQRHDATLRNSPLPWALSNTKLFRRSLIEEHGIRYPEDLPILSDQPFTLELCFRARAISILNDYAYYYAVRRKDASNVTYRGGLEARLRGTERIMRLTERFTDTPDSRYGLNRRHLSSELADVLGPNLLLQDRETQERIVAGAGRLVADFATDALLARMTPRVRIRMLLAKAGATDALLEALRFEAEEPEPRHRIAGGQAYLEHPAFHAAGVEIADRYFETGADLLGQVVLDGTSLEATASRSPFLVISGSAPFQGLDRLLGTVQLETVSRTPIGERVLRRPVEAAYVDTAEGGTAITLTVPLSRLLDDGAGEGGKWNVRLRLVTGAGTARLLPVPQLDEPVRIPARRGARLYRLLAAGGSRGELRLDVSPVRAARVIAQRLRRLRAATGRK